jgi:hypothetical protein
MGTIDTKEFAPLAGEAKIKRLTEIREQFSGSDLVDQRSRVLLALRDFPVSTYEARKYLDVMHIAGRVMELREFGWQIETLWSYEFSDSGKKHRIGLYVYRGGGGDDAK